MSLTLNDCIASVLLIASIFYAASGGADYGAGFWNLLASLQDKSNHESLVDTAIKPIWEANHVWLILIVTVLFTAFPSAFSFLSTTLNIPLVLLLAGVILRGVGFAFKINDSSKEEVHRRWMLIFSIGSIGTPIILGMILGAMASGRLDVEGADVYSTYVAPWTTPFCFSMGFATLLAFTFLAAVYLTVDAAEKKEIQQYYRKAALCTQLLLIASVTATVMLARTEAPLLWDGLLRHNLLTVATLAAFLFKAAGVILCLVTNRYKFARISAATEIATLVCGFFGVQYPYLFSEKLTLFNCAAPNQTLILLLISILIGACTLFPSLLFLYSIFKGTGKYATTGASLGD